MIKDETGQSRPNGAGYYLMNRGWLEQPALTKPNDKYDRRSAWCWLMERAAYKPTQINCHGRSVPVQRGQFCTTLAELAKAWGWDRAMVQRFLTRLAADTMIDTATDTGRTLITICNYDAFQGGKIQDDTGADTLGDTDPIQSRYRPDTQKKERKERKERKEDGFKGIHRDFCPQDSNYEVPIGGVVIDHADCELLGRVVGLPDPVPEAYRLWNEMAEREGLPQAQILTRPRRSGIAARLKQAGGIEGWKHALSLIAANPFMHGHNDRNWKAHLDFLIQPSKFTKLMEGGYPISKAPQPKGRGHDPEAIRKEIWG